MKESLKEILRNNKIVILVAIIIPIFVHVLYSVYISDALSSKWTAGEMLVYFGTIFSVVVVLKGIFNSLNMHFKDTINSVIPYISIESLNIRSRKNIFNNDSLCDKSEEIYEEFVVNQLCFNICKGKVELKDKLQEKQMQIIRNNGRMTEELSPGVYAVIQKQFFALFLLCKNVGKGCAINTNVGLQIDEESPVFSIPFTMNIGNDIIVRIFSESPTNEIFGKYYLIFRYDDIYGNEYIKKHELIISEDKGKSKLNVKPIIEHNYVNC